MDYSKNIVMITCCILLSICNFARCNIDKDRERCANNLVGLAPCLAYVSGQSKAPPIDCCTGFKQVLQKSPECVCILVKDRNDPSLGFTINATRALGLPSECHVPPDTPANISNCPAILHLAPNSPDAKVFEDFANNGKKSNGTNAPAPADSADARASGAGRSAAAGAAGNSNDAMKLRNRWFGIGKIAGLLLAVFVHVLPYL